MYTSSRNAKQFLPIQHFLFRFVQSVMDGEARLKRRGMRGSPCSPPSCWRISWRFPASSCHTYLEGWEKMDLTNGKRGRSPGTSNSFAIIALWSTWSYAPTPSMERSVASVPLRHDSHWMPNAVDSGPSGQRALEWSASPRSWRPTYGTWCLKQWPTPRGTSPGKLVGCTIQQLKGFLVIQTHLQHFVRASSRSW